jgi:O-antigen ligase
MSKRLLAVGAVALIGAPTALSFFSGGFFDRPRVIAGIAASALVLVVAIFARRPLPSSTPGRVALAGLFLLTAWTALSLTWAPLGGRAQDDLQRLLLYLGFFIASLALLRGRDVRRWLEPALVLGALVVVGYALAERLLPGLIELDRSRTASGRLEQPIGYWNALGSVAAVGLVLAVRVAGDPGRGGRLRAAAAAAGVPIALAVYLSFSRGALAALAAGLVMLMALAPHGRPQLRGAVVILGAGALASLLASRFPEVESLPGGHQGDAADGLVMLAALVMLAVAAAVLVAPGPTREQAQVSLPVSRPAAVLTLGAVVLLMAAIASAALEGRPQGASPVKVGPERLGSIDSNRYRYWRVAVETWADRPFAGIGSGGFLVEWRKRPDRVDQAGDAHSLYLETAAELGLVGLVMLLAFFGGVGAAAVRLYQRNPEAAAGPVAALSAWALHAGLEWTWELPAVTLTAVLLAGAVVAWSEEQEDEATHPAPAGARVRERVT